MRFTAALPLFARAVRISTPAIDPAPGASPAIGPSKPRLLKTLGPGLITGASDDDPSGIGTYSQAGAQWGYALNWTMVLTFPLMAAVQEISARLGRTTGHGIAGLMARHAPNPVLQLTVALLFLANVVNIGADLGAMADAASLIAGGPRLPYVVAFGGLSILLQVFLQYTRYVAILKWLTLSLFAYVGALLAVGVPWREALLGMVPALQFDRGHLTMVVAILGTTISPYLFFWQAAQEVEDIHAKPRREPLLKARWQALPAFARIRADTLVGMGFSNLIAIAIMTVTAATLHASHAGEITSSAEAARALEPVAGHGAALVFALGIVGTGLLAVPVLAGSAAYAIGEARRWPVGLARQPQEARAFYLTLGLATLLGMALNFTPVNPIQALYWAAIVNGIVAVPVMVVLMRMGCSRQVMGEFAVRGVLRWLGWLATAAMALAALAMIGSWLV